MKDPTFHNFADKNCRLKHKARKLVMATHIRQLAENRSSCKERANGTKLGKDSKEGVYEGKLKPVQ